jgi:hypothetical protein
MPEPQILDDFVSLSHWSAVASVRAGIELSLAEQALRLRFIFQSRYGFVVARKELALQLPQSYAFAFLLRGEGGPLGFEFKLTDGQNVWRYLANLVLPSEFREFRIEACALEFGWGPQGVGLPEKITALEFALTPYSPGQGWMEIKALKLLDLTYRRTPRVLASSALPGHAPEQVLHAGEIGWESEPVAPQWLLVDFGELRPLGGLGIVWEPARRALAFEVQLSTDGKTWEVAYATSQGGSEVSYVYLPGAKAQQLKLVLLSSSGPGFGIVHLKVKPPEFARSLDEFVAALAKEFPLGWYPKHWRNKQSYWTVIGTPHTGPVGLMNQEGMVEAGEGGFALEPFVYFDGRLYTWQEAEITQSLAQGWLPLPQVKWELKGVTLEILGFPETEGVCLCLRVQSPLPKSVRLFVAVRPFQVLPYWQKWRRFGGVFPIRRLEFSQGKVLVDEKFQVIPQASARFGALAFAQGSVLNSLSAGELPPATRVEDPLGLAEGALEFALELASSEPKEIWLKAGGLSVTAQAVPSVWSQEELKVPRFHLPPSASQMLACLKTCAAHILVNRKGAALRPGPRRYRRAWIRDGVGMGWALARLGMSLPLREFLTFYAGFQAEDGSLPDCIDELGAEWLPEFDAYGQFLHGLAEYVRLTGEREWLEEMWPYAQKALSRLEALRAERLTSAFQTPAGRPYYGLLPESMSHEGYLAQPVHALWDDLWALAGIQGASFLAKSLRRKAEFARLLRLAAEFGRNLRAAVEAACTRLGIEYVPGSIELGDFDPSAIAIACALGVEDCLPSRLLAQTFTRYCKGLKERVEGSSAWVNYSPYEVRIVQALVRLGRRKEALALLDFLLADRRIPAWNQWPEIAWRNKEAPCFLGDLPHTWVGAEYILAVLCLFAYEQKDKLIVAAGIPWEWLSEGEIAVEDLPTRYGNLAYVLRQEKGALSLHLEGVKMPPGGITVKLPKKVAAEKTEHYVASGRTVVLRRVPQKIRLRCACKTPLG